MLLTTLRQILEILSLQVSDPRLAGIEADDIPHRCILDGYFILTQTVIADLFGCQIAHRDVDFFIFCVAGQADYFHAVE